MALLGFLELGQDFMQEKGPLGGSRRGRMVEGALSWAEFLVVVCRCHAYWIALKCYFGR